MSSKHKIFVVDGLKQCARCGEVKQISLFSRDEQHISGFKSACKVCAKKDWQSWRKKNLTSAREKDRISHYKRTYSLSEEVARNLVANRKEFL